MSEDFLKNPASLTLLLAQADAGDLDTLVDYITDSGEGRISSTMTFVRVLLSARSSMPTLLLTATS